MGKPNRIGVLFVHGIGSQPKGETLVRFGEPCVEWIKQWFSGADWAWARARAPGRTEQAIDAIQHTPGSDTQPESFNLRLSYKGYQQTQLDESWLFAECHWAESFPRPDTNDVNSWLMLVSPMVISIHLARQVRMIRKRLGSLDGSLDGSRPHQGGRQSTVRVMAKIGTFLQLIVSIFLFLMAPLIALAVLGVLLVLRAIAVIPLGPTVKFVETVQDVLSTVIGDSWIFVSSPLRAALIDQRFREDLQWMRSNCDEVVVIAHSQGAAVAWRGLNQLHDAGRLGDDIRILVTLGSGLAKLDHLSKRESKEPLRVNYQTIFGLTVLAPILISLALLFSGWWFLVALLMTPGAFLGFLTGGWVESEQDKMLADSRFLTLNMQWKDYVSTADPVPNGPLDNEQPRSNFHSQEVSNEGSLLADHNAYWANRDEFVGNVLTFISQHTQTRIPLHAITPIDQQVIAIGSQLRRWQVRLLVLCRWSLRIVALATLLLPGAVQTLGMRINQWADPAVSLFDKLYANAVGGYLGSHSTVGMFAVLIGYLLFNEALTLFFRWGNESGSRNWYFKRMPVHGAESSIWLSVPVGLSVALLLIALNVTSLLWSAVTGVVIVVLITSFASAAFSSLDRLPDLGDEVS